MCPHHHRFRMRKRGPILLRSCVVLRSQAIVIADEVFSRNRVAVINVVVDLDESVVQRGVTDWRNGITDSIPILKYAETACILGAISRTAVSQTGDLEAEIFRGRRSR